MVSRISLKLGGRLAHCEDSYRKIDACEGCIYIIKRGYKPTWIKSAPRQKVAAHNPTIYTKASYVLDTEVVQLLKKGAICKVGRANPEPEKFNINVFYVYFCMEDLKTVREWF